MIEISQLSKIYVSDTHQFQALDKISLTIPKGEIFGILGRSGAGKSTLLRCINLLEKPTSGQIFINHKDISSFNADKLRHQRRKISMIFQHFNLLESRNVFENIALPLEITGKSSKEIEDKVNELLKLVDLEHKKNYYPHQLSGGQKQRVAIARALATDPEILLSDEATSALDVESTKSILNLLKKINQKLHLTIVLITHELDVIKQICTSTAVLDKGKIVEQGSAIDILINPQSEITQQLVLKSLHFLDNPNLINPPSENAVLIQLTFVGKDSETPIISTVVKKFDVAVNIQQAQIENIQNTKVGFTICEIIGKPDDLEKALSYIQSTSVKVKVIHHA